MLVPSASRLFLNLHALFNSKKNRQKAIKKFSLLTSGKCFIVNTVDLGQLSAPILCSIPTVFHKAESTVCNVCQKYSIESNAALIWISLTWIWKLKLFKDFNVHFLSQKSSNLVRLIWFSREMSRLEKPKTLNKKAFYSNYLLTYVILFWIKIILNQNYDDKF